MGNPEHLKILKQGVEAWNQWRNDRPDEGINLSGETLDRIDLEQANLAKVNLKQALLRAANLKRVNLEGADLTDANVEQTKFHGANLSRALFTRATLYKAEFYKATLHQADLRQANLLAASLHKADLQGADLRDADLREATLVQTNLSEADLTGAKLYGTSRDDWIIDDVRCAYIFWDFHKEERTPIDRDFRPGEFEQLYKALPTIKYYFEHGFTPLDPLIMDQVVQAINQQHPEFELRLDSFHSRGQPHAVFTVIHHEQTDAGALEQITASYEARLAALEGKQEQLMALFGHLTSNPQPQLISGCEQVIITGRDYFEHIDGSAQVHTGIIGGTVAD
jgi:hypothetical protein